MALTGVSIGIFKIRIRDGKSIQLQGRTNLSIVLQLEGEKFFLPKNYNLLLLLQTLQANVLQELVLSPSMVGDGPWRREEISPEDSRMNFLHYAMQYGIYFQNDCDCIMYHSFY